MVESCAEMYETMHRSVVCINCQLDVYISDCLYVCMYLPSMHVYVSMSACICVCVYTCGCIYCIVFSFYWKKTLLTERNNGTSYSN